MACLSPDRLVQYIASTVSASELSEIEAHVEGCEPCRAAVAATIRAGRSESAQPTERGNRIGRYIVQQLHGTGAMGHVLEARDPDLDRRVAIKVVRHHGDGIQERALREGRALARIAHPNVVAVHDVGTWDGGVFLAMELVDGTNLRGWLETPRSPREVIRIFADVARGLSAVHDAELVHRDIKPENLVVGSDGRVRVLDFGLATETANRAERSGTPAYMAPEQDLGDATAASDQYAFAVTLHEALEGSRPQGTRRFSRTPRWARASVERALSADPSDRFPSMMALARELERGLGRRRRLAIGSGVALALATGLVAMGLILRDGDHCRSGPPLDGLDAVHAALVAQAGHELADAATAKLRAWETRASELRASTCKAARADERDAGERLRCVDAVVRDVHVLVAALGHPNEMLTLDALSTIDRASDLSPCTSAIVPRERDPFLGAGIDVQLSALIVADARGDWADAERGALALATRLDDDATRRYQARAWLIVGQARMTSRHIVAAREAFERALLAAERAGDESLRGEIYLALVGANLEPARRPEARRWLALGTALLTKIGDPAVAWRVGLMEGALDDDPARGARVLRAALDAYAKKVPAGDQNTVRLLGTLGNVLESAHQLDDAIATLRQATALGERVVGPTHPELIQPLQELAYCLAEAGQHDESITVAKRALAIAERRGGDVGVSTIRLALELVRAEKSLPDALVLVDRAVPLVAAYDGPRSALTANVLQLRGILRSQTGHDAEAVDDFLRSLELQRAYLPPDSPDLIDLLEFLGRGQRTLARTDDAIHSFVEAKQVRGRQPDHKPSDDVAIETAMGGTLVDAGRAREGTPHLEKALELARTGTDREAIGFAEVELAKALTPSNRARQLLRDANAIYRSLDANERERLVGWKREIDALLGE